MNCSWSRSCPRPPPALGVCLLLLLALMRVSAAGRLSVDDLRLQLAAHLAQPRFAAATWGVKVVALETGATLFEHKAGKLLKPASTAKLFTAALALDRLGSAFRIRTSAFARSRPDAQGTVAGDLVIYGRGDPSLAARFNNGDYDRSLEPLAAAIAAAGIRRIAGDLVGDDSYFVGPPFGTGWAWDDLQSYFGAEVSALSADDNTVDLFFSAGPRPGTECRVVTGPGTPFLRLVNRTVTAPRGTPASIRIERGLGESTVTLTGQLPLGETNLVDAVTVPKPSQWFLVRLREALGRHGIAVGGTARVAARPEGALRPGDPRWHEIARAESRPMAELVERMMKHSQNLYAQLLLLQAGAASDGTHAVGATTEAAGLAALKRFVERAGIAPGEVLLEEGAGLSHGSAATPNALVALLRHMVGHREAAAFLAALPGGGMDNSLRRRFSEAPLAGNLRAKPGALHHVSALAGYVTAAGGKRLAFAVLLNQYGAADEKSSAMAEVDAAVRLIARLDSVEAPALKGR